MQIVIHKPRPARGRDFKSAHTDYRYIHPAEVDFHLISNKAHSTIVNNYFMSRKENDRMNKIRKTLPLR